MPTIAGLFDSSRGAEQAVEALRRSGFDNKDINVISQDTALQDQLGGGPTIGDEASDRAAETQAETSPVFTATSGGPVVGATPPSRGGAADDSDRIDALTELGLSQDAARYYYEAIKHGGTLVTVAADDARRSEVEEIFRRASAVNFQRGE